MMLTVALRPVTDVRDCSNYGGAGHASAFPDEIWDLYYPLLLTGDASEALKARAIPKVRYGRFVAGIDAKARRRISRTWRESFPHLEIWRPMRLLRRVGPVLQGICLDQIPGRDHYFPTAHVHPLTMDFPVISLSLRHRLAGWNGVNESVLAAASEADVRDAADRLRAQSPLPLDRTPTLDEILAAYRDYLLLDPVSRRGPGNEVKDLLALAKFSLSEQVMAEQTAFVAELAKSWAYRPDGVHLRDECLRLTLAEVPDRAALRAVVDSQILRLKVDRLKFAEEL